MDLPDLGAVGRDGLNMLWPGAGEDQSLRDRELGDILSYQLTVPLAATAASGRSPAIDASFGQTGQLSLSALLHDEPSPPLELVRRVKVWAKASVNDPEGPLPAPVARVLYYACIAVARVRCGESITDLSAAELSEGLRWSERQTWIDAATGRLLRDGLLPKSPAAV